MGQMLVFTNAVEGRDDDFNRWYDDVHLAEVLALPVFTGARRYRLADAQLFDDQSFRYVAIYEYRGTAREAVDALMQASASFDMGDSMDMSAQHVVLVEDLDARVTPG
jgi:hypothetical protein